MNDWQLGAIAFFALEALIAVAMVGKPRKSTTPGSAVISILIYAALIYVAVKA